MKMGVKPAKRHASFRTQMTLSKPWIKSKAKTSVTDGSKSNSTATTTGLALVSSKFLLLQKSHKIVRQSKTVRLQHFINEDNRHRLAKIRGLAWGVTRIEVACLF